MSAPGPSSSPASSPLNPASASTPKQAGRPIGFGTPNLRGPASSTAVSLSTGLTPLAGGATASSSPAPGFNLRGLPAGGAETSSGAVPLAEPTKGLHLFLQESLPSLQSASARYFDSTEGASNASSTQDSNKARDALVGSLSSALQTLSEYGLAQMPLQPVPAPASSSELVEDVQTEFEKRERIREGARLIQSVLKQ
ncbi:hypothetical protein OC846_000063 [Tilletia horrida]|uniref:Uncharacterized protein n=1 Tax=Tilletia horrida TaxID=155126 RepID=A0AAN6GXM5_9BASI|nr:hypothetical protein OC846_000063 [Tilletia horrida]